VAAAQVRLAAAKRVREVARADNERALEARSFAHSDALAVDFEQHKQAVGSLHASVQALQARYAQAVRRAAE